MHLRRQLEASTSLFTLSNMMMRVEEPDTGIRISAPPWQTLDLADPQVDHPEGEKDDDDSDEQDDCMPLPHI